MKKNYHLILPGLLLTSAISSPVNAALTNSTIQPTDGGNGTLTEYLVNLGLFLGYNIKTAPKDEIIASLFPETTAQEKTQQALIETAIGAIPVNGIGSTFVPPDSDNSNINTQANAPFPKSSYATPSQGTTTSGSAAQGASITVSPLIDQMPYQTDPVSQAVLNILDTPDSSYCFNKDGSLWTGGPLTPPYLAYPKCNYLHSTLVTTNVIGTILRSSTSETVIPNPSEFFSSDYNQPFLSQLNSNSLIGPLLYSNNSDSTTTPNGLPAQNQMQIAANFVRYASGTVIPLQLPTRKQYTSIYEGIIGQTNDIKGITESVYAYNRLSNYLASIRVYAAQSSVGFGNLYYILSKRLPQNDEISADNKNPPSSQALNEFKMATWRLFNTDKSTKTQWLEKINNASSASVQKEMVTLLAEINYQLYLTRQQEERLLLTNSMLLLLNARSIQPNPNTLVAPKNNP